MVFMTELWLTMNSSRFGTNIISAAAAAMPWPCTVPTPDRVFM